MIKLAKKERVRYEMILAWSTAKRPFKSQKLAFYAPAKFSLAYKEAQEIVGIMQRAGGLKKSAVKLIAIGVENVMQEYMTEHAPYLLKKDADLKAQVKRFIKTKNDDDDKKAAKSAFKRASQFTKDGGNTFEMSIPATTKLKAKIPKAKIAPPMEPMIDARKPKRIDSVAKPIKKRKLS